MNIDNLFEEQKMFFIKNINVDSNSKILNSPVLLNQLNIKDYSKSLYNVLS